ncbi:hypothetical protein K439DRAFT_1614779 [Ramaria rubella]|nr:hypothetical protein K439DRAFT_1614779 [Ramaria rubella]
MSEDITVLEILNTALTVNVVISTEAVVYDIHIGILHWQFRWMARRVLGSAPRSSILCSENLVKTDERAFDKASLLALSTIKVRLYPRRTWGRSRDIALRVPLLEPETDPSPFAGNIVLLDHLSLVNLLIFGFSSVPIANATERYVVSFKSRWGAPSNFSLETPILLKLSSLGIVVHSLNTTSQSRASIYNANEDCQPERAVWIAPIFCVALLRHIPADSVESSQGEFPSSDAYNSLSDEMLESVLGGDHANKVVKKLLRWDPGMTFELTRRQLQGTPVWSRREASSDLHTPTPLISGLGSLGRRALLIAPIQEIRLTPRHTKCKGVHIFLKLPSMELALSLCQVHYERPGVVRLGLVPTFLSMFPQHNHGLRLVVSYVLPPPGARKSGRMDPYKDGPLSFLLSGLKYHLPRPTSPGGLDATKFLSCLGFVCGRLLPSDFHRHDLFLAYCCNGCKVGAYLLDQPLTVELMSLTTVRNQQDIHVGWSSVCGFFVSMLRVPSLPVYGLRRENISHTTFFKYNHNANFTDGEYFVETSVKKLISTGILSMISTLTVAQAQLASSYLPTSSSDNFTKSWLAWIMSLEHNKHDVALLVLCNIGVADMITAEEVVIFEVNIVFMWVSAFELPILRNKLLFIFFSSLKLRKSGVLSVAIAKTIEIVPHEGLKPV